MPDAVEPLDILLRGGLVGMGIDPDRIRTVLAPADVVYEGLGFKVRRRELVLLW